MNPEVYQDRLCVRAIRFAENGRTDIEAIEAAMAYSQEQHIGVVLIDSRDWLIERSIEVPSDTTVIVDGVCVKLADEVLDNIFRPAGMDINPEDPYGFPFEIHPSRNIRILGRNGARLEGPDVNPVMYHPVLGEWQKALGDFWGWRGFMIFFSRCDGFEVSGFVLEKTYSWAITLERSKNGYLHDLQVYSDCKNGDGINLRIGCSRIFIENFKAKTSDDCIAINTAGSTSRKYPIKNYIHTTHPSDYLIDQGEPIEERYIHDIYIRNVITATDHYSQGVAFLARQGHKIFNVWINGVYDANPVATPRRINMVGAYYTGYADGKTSEGDLARIRIDDVVANSTDTALLFRYPVKDLWVANVVQNNPEGVVLTALEKEREIPLPGCSAVNGQLKAPAEGWVFKRL